VGVSACIADHCQVPWWDSKHLPDWLVAVAAAVIGSLVGVAIGFLIYNFCCRRYAANTYPVRDYAYHVETYFVGI